MNWFLRSVLMWPKYLRGIIIIALFLGIFSKCTAQGYLEGANLSYDLIPLKVTNSIVDKGFYGNDIKLNDFFPVFLKKDRSQYLVVGLNLESFSFSGTHPDFPVTNLYSIAPMLGYGWQINKKLSLSALFTPLLNSDLVEVKNSDIHMGGVVRGAYHVYDNLLIRLTLGCRTQFYGPQYIVLIGFDWQITDKWRLFGEVPNLATLSYSFNKKVNAGISYIAGNTSYGLSEQNRYIQYTFTQPGLFAEYYLTSILAVRATVAYSVQRGLDLYNMNDKIPGGVVDYINLGSQVTPLNTEVANGPAYKLSLSVRIPEPKNK